MSRFPRRQNPVVVCLLLLLPVILPARPAIAQDPSPTAAETMPACFDFVWSNAHDDPWFLDEQGRRVIPEVTHEWLTLTFGDRSEQSDQSDMSEPSGVPEQTFDQRYAEFFDYRLTIFGTPDRVLYRLRQGLPYQAFGALMKRLKEDPEVRFVQPVWRIDGQFHAAPETIEITWKAVTPAEERRQLLATAGAVETAAAGKADAETIRIDPCLRAPWRAAVLLAQDLRVVSAVPRLFQVETPVAILFQLDTRGALTGTPIPFRLEIRFREGIRIESATLANLDLKPGGIFRNLYEVNFDRPLSAVDLSRSPITVTGHLLIYAPGEVAIPSVPVYYTNSREESPDRNIRTLTAPSIPLRIASLVPDIPGDYRLRLPPPAAPPPLFLPGIAGRLKTARLMTLSGLILLAAAIGGWWWLNRSRPDEGDRPQDLRRKELRENLTAWTGREAATMKVEDWASFGIALKEYLGETAGLPAEERGGSHAFFVEKLKNLLPETERQQVALVLGKIDHILAGGPLAAEEIDSLFTRVELLVDHLEAGREETQYRGRQDHARD